MLKHFKFIKLNLFFKFMGVIESVNEEDKFFGFRIYRISEGGPLHQAGLKELEDFIIPPKEVLSHKISFSDYIIQNAGKKLNLSIYSLLRRYFFNVEITPHLEWSVNRDQGYLGASVRYENWSTADKHLLRAIQVNPNSPAEKELHLVPYEDYIIAIRPEGEDFLTLNVDVTDPLNLFSNYLWIHRNKLTEFFIFNSNKGARLVKIKVGTEPLGCDVAYGKLHEFPKLKTLENNQDSIQMDKKEEELDDIQVTDEKIDKLAFNNSSEEIIPDSEKINLEN